MSDLLLHNCMSQFLKVTHLLSILFPWKTLTNTNVASFGVAMISQQLKWCRIFTFQRTEKHALGEEGDNDRPVWTNTQIRHILCFFSRKIYILGRSTSLVGGFLLEICFSSERKFPYWPMSTCCPDAVWGGHTSTLPCGGWSRARGVRPGFLCLWFFLREILLVYFIKTTSWRAAQDGWCSTDCFSQDGSSAWLRCYQQGQGLHLGQEPTLLLLCSWHLLMPFIRL